MLYKPLPFAFPLWFLDFTVSRTEILKYHTYCWNHVHTYLCNLADVKYTLRWYDLTALSSWDRRRHHNFFCFRRAGKNAGTNLKALKAFYN